MVATRMPELIGGHPALDLVNTVSWRRDDERRRDNLVDLPALLGWCLRVDLLDPSAAADVSELGARDQTSAQRVLDEVRDLREQLAAVLAPLTDTPPSGIVGVIPAALRAHLIDAIAVSDLVGSPARWRLAARRPADLPRVLALQALDLLQSPEVHRLRRCAGPGCGWLFLDRTRSNTRRWCSSGDCGNRDRARRHYARRHDLVPE
ncbi:CGNR zinc finger domain-containing protein [Pengzhenrongella sp.]|uniref:CGNR zinc finger domain-containing protein n=1 Tax=Pengzhenrongella sp. TaxID=2888820 RepID=UPI002F946D97